MNNSKLPYLCGYPLLEVGGLVFQVVKLYNMLRNKTTIHDITNFIFCGNKTKMIISIFFLSYKQHMFGIVEFSEWVKVSFQFGFGL